MDEPTSAVETSRGTLTTKTFRFPDAAQRRAWLERAGQALLAQCDRLAKRLNPESLDRPDLELRLDEKV
jgi:hypothetical protein